MNGKHQRKNRFSLRLDPQVESALKDVARHEGISVNHLISLAVAEKIARSEMSSLMHRARLSDRKSAN